MKKIYPVDFLSLPFDKIDEWRNDFFIPQPAEEACAFYRSIKETYYQAVKKHEGTFVGDILLTKIKIYQEFTKVLCGLNFIKRLEDAGCAPVCSDRSPLLNKLINKDFNFSNSLQYSELKDEDALYVFYRKMRNILYSMKVNNDALYYFHTKKDNLKILNVMPCYETILYAKKKGCSFCYASPLDWLHGAHRVKLESSMSDEIYSVAEELTENVRAVVMEQGLEVPQDILMNLKKFTIIHLSASAKEFITVDARMQKRGPFCVLGGAQSSFLHRSISLCNRRRGGWSLGFNHGNDAFSNRDLRFELSIVNEFFTYTEGGAKLIRERDRDMFKPFTSNEPKISALDTDLYLKLWEHHRKMPFSGEVKTVMVTGYPYDFHEILTYGPPDIAFFDLEVKLVKLLADAGFEVIYKAHPEACHHMPNIYGDKVKIVRDPFEQVLEQADAFVFLYSYTSVFPIGLCTRKPAVLLDTLKIHRYHTKEIYELLEKRCKVINVYNGQGNRFTFDAGEMVEYLKRKHGEPDIELLEKYMFPADYKKL